MFLLLWLPPVTAISSLYLGDGSPFFSLLLSDCESVDCWSVDSLVLMSPSYSRAIWLSLTGTFFFEFSGSMEEAINLMRIVNVTGTVCDLLIGLKWTGSHGSRSITAEILTCRPKGVLPKFPEVSRCGIENRCRKVPNNTFLFGQTLNSQFHRLNRSLCKSTCY